MPRSPASTAAPIAYNWVSSSKRPTDGAPTDAVRDTVAALATPPIPGLPPLTGGLVGTIGYDAVRRWERLGDTARDELQLPELAMMLATDLAVLDVTADGLRLVELADGVTLEELRAKTEPEVLA